MGLESENGFGFVIRYNYCTEVNDLFISKQLMSDIILDYSKERFHIGLSALNIVNCCFAPSRNDHGDHYQNERDAAPVVHLTPGNPFFIKGSLSYYF